MTRYAVSIHIALNSPLFMGEGGVLEDYDSYFGRLEDSFEIHRVPLYDEFLVNVDIGSRCSAFLCPSFRQNGGGSGPARSL